MEAELNVLLGKLGMEGYQIRWCQKKDIPLLWHQTKDGKWEILVLVYTKYGTFKIPYKFKQWINKYRDDGITSNHRYYSDKQRFNAWNILAFLHSGEESKGLALNEIPEDFYQYDLFEIDEYDGLESIILNHQEMKLHRENKKLQQEIIVLKEKVALLEAKLLKVEEVHSSGVTK